MACGHRDPPSRHGRHADGCGGAGGMPPVLRRDRSYEWDGGGCDRGAIGRTVRSPLVRTTATRRLPIGIVARSVPAPDPTALPPALQGESQSGIGDWRSDSEVATAVGPFEAIRADGGIGGVHGSMAPDGRPGAPGPFPRCGRPRAAMGSSGRKACARRTGGRQGRSARRGGSGRTGLVDAGALTAPEALALRAAGVRRTGAVCGRQASLPI